MSLASAKRSGILIPICGIGSPNHQSEGHDPGSAVACQSGNTASHAGGGIDNAKAGHLTIQSSSKVTGNSALVGFGADLEALGSVQISKDSTVGVIGK